MQLLTAHKILIGSAIAMFVFYGASELRSYFLGESSALLSAAAAALAAVGLGFYLRWVLTRRPGTG